MLTALGWRGINGGLLGVFAASLIVVPWGYALVPMLATAVAVCGLPALCRRWRRLDGEDALWCLTLIGYGGLWLMDVWRTGVWPEGEGNQGVGLPLWPLLAAWLLVWLRCYAPSPRLWWLGIAAGALAAGGIALFERLVLQYSRASNGMNAIPFGNIALLLGCLSLLATLWWSYRPRASAHRLVEARGWVVLALVAAMGGILASLLSGTRGGWLAMPLLLGLCVLAWRRLPRRPAHRRGRGRRVAVALCLGLVLTTLPISGAWHRLEHAAQDFQGYWQGEERGDSVGLRLEMWRAGWHLFLERPWSGWGEGRLEAARDAMVARGDLHPGVSAYDQLHSDVIDTAARRGLPGLVTLAMLYGVPLWLFARRLGHADAGVRLLAVAGLMIPVAFLEFGLTQSMLRDVRGLSGYLGLGLGCWAVMRREERRAVQTDPHLPS